MLVNKLLPSIQPSLSVVKGSAKHRNKAARQLTEQFYKEIIRDFKDDYSIVPNEQLQKSMDSVLPDKNFKIKLKSIKPDKDATYDGVCKGIFDANDNVKSLEIDVECPHQALRACHIPVLSHEFLHAVDDMYNPKYMTRVQKLVKKGLDTNEYIYFYKDNFYCEEFFKTRKKKKELLELIKNKTKEFLENFDISDKLDYIQDMRYSLTSELNAYKTQYKIASKLKSKGFLVKPAPINYPKKGLFKEKIDLLKQLAKEYIKQEREMHKQFLEKS